MTQNADSPPLPPTRRPRTAPLGERPTLTDAQRVALEAYADTVVPGRKRHPDDVAIAGVDDTPGAVECGALDVLTDPATGIEDGVGGMADLLDQRAVTWATARELPDPVGRFADLGYTDRRRLVAELTDPEEPEKDLWFLVALFATMAYDSAPHLETADALDPAVTPASGLRAMGFFPPVDGRWAFDRGGYGRPLARLRAGTDDHGDPR
ncbi:DUF5987 family protein [Myceligenerans xiligouense]|uniref:Gluconate 2-dehydrogenase subunit 3-like protein n=1 Tax=Myceligenerans xiligouense TaxID=253184 RepID=A0A3N4YK94_9MICO|nr:DUF5987 family protein [Myceligenerans xiligouense]RPF19724.1 hypothetical protein EDD34_0287 [Myceligenerans xiligouense]